MHGVLEIRNKSYTNSIATGIIVYGFVSLRSMGMGELVKVYLWETVCI